MKTYSSQNSSELYTYTTKIFMTSTCKFLLLLILCRKKLEYDTNLHNLRKPSREGGISVQRSEFITRTYIAPVMLAFCPELWSKVSSEFVLEVTFVFLLTDYDRFPLHPGFPYKTRQVATFMWGRLSFEYTVY